MATLLQCRPGFAVPATGSLGSLGRSRWNASRAASSSYCTPIRSPSSTASRQFSQAPALAWRSRQQQCRGSRIQVTALGGPQPLFEVANIAPLLPRLMPMLWRAATAGLGLFFALNWQTYRRWRIDAENEMTESLKRSEERKERLKRFEPPQSTDNNSKQKGS